MNEPVVKKPRKSDTLKPVTDLLNLMKSYNVRKFKVGDVEVEFNPVMEELNLDPISYDETDTRERTIDAAKKSLKEQTEEEMTDLLWST